MTYDRRPLWLGTTKISHEPQGAELLTELMQDEATITRRATEIAQNARSICSMFPFTPHCGRCGANLQNLYAHEAYCEANKYSPKHAKAKLAEALIREAIHIAPHFPGTPAEKADAAIETIDAVIDRVLARVRK